MAQRRLQQPWPANREFKILSIDGGGIKGIFPARVLAELEQRFLGGSSIAEQFDLITGTSTGGIIGLGLSIGLPANVIAKLYVDRGGEIFPPYAQSWWGRFVRRVHEARSFVYSRYDRAALQVLLEETFGSKLLGDARARLCIPACDGRYGDVYIFKTPHHPDYRKDQHEKMTTVACATAAAPTFFHPLESGGFRFIDGGLWANNPIMVGLVDALACFDIDRHQVRILSLGCGDEPYVVSDRVAGLGGKLSWADVVLGSMAYQAHNALGQARLLVGADRVLRVAPPTMQPSIRLDDWIRAKEALPAAASHAVDQHGRKIARDFFANG